MLEKNDSFSKFKNLTKAKHQLEWLIEMCVSLINGRYTGSIEVQFKEGGICSITKPKENVLTHSQVRRAGIGH